jgi:FkbM family methyltransferase
MANAMNKVKQNVNRIPVLGSVVRSAYRWMRRTATGEQEACVAANQSQPQTAEIVADFRYKVGRFDLYFPEGHALKLIQSVMPTYDRAFRYIVREIGAASPGGTFIDVGANVGDTAAWFVDCAPSNPVVCVEAFDKILPYLHRNAELIGPQVTIVEKFVRIAALDKENLVFSWAPHQTGGFVPADKDNGDKIANDKFISIRDLKEKYCPHSAIALFKSDTDGFDPAIILENMDLLKREQSCLFLEYGPTVALGGYAICSNLIRRLEQENYAIILFDNHGRLMLHAETPYAALIEELLSWVVMQSKIGGQHIHYFDLWAFPPQRIDLFRRLRVSSAAEMKHEFNLDLP